MLLLATRPPHKRQHSQHFFSTEEKTEKKKKEKGMPFRQRSVGRLSRFAQKKYYPKRSVDVEIFFESNP
ncbi:hypothetical protein HW49_06450 [Porphyromonadaceae bacterium COT-184 OH4590]|nr:hypothetical protein HW49_06450 [Porphyromonadaceae bacterium COT-184 OH4590]